MRSTQFSGLFWVGIILLMNCGAGVLALQHKPRSIQPEASIKINLDKTAYPLIRSVAVEEMGWLVSGRAEHRAGAHVHWADAYVTEQFVRRLKNYQRVNHFPGSQQLGNKDLLSQNLNSMRRLSLNDYDFFPRTWILPQQQDLLRTYQRQTATQCAPQWYITKPCDSSQGRGIRITSEIDPDCKELTVVQEYITNPLLIEGLKFDFRIYVLLRSLAPLKIYKYQEGLVRLATQKYEQPSSLNSRNLYVHLTNYAINKSNPCFVQNKVADQDFLGHKRSMTAVMASLAKMGCDVAALQEQIDGIIVKTIMSAHKKMSACYKNTRIQDQQQQQSVCFQVLGFDILVDSSFKPWLIEVNHAPSFCTDSPLDYFVKRYLILDTLNCLNCKYQDKQCFVKNKSKEHNCKALDQQDKVKQGLRLGAYKCLFPSSKQALNRIFQRITDKKSKQIRLRRVYFKEEGLNSSLQSTELRRSRNFTLYGQLESLRQQAKQMKSISNQNNEQTRKSQLVTSGKRRVISSFKLKNIDISFQQQQSSRPSEYMLRNTAREVSCKSEMSDSFSKYAGTAESQARHGRVKRLDQQIRCCIGKMKLARIKLNKIKSLSRRQPENLLGGFHTARMLKQQNIFMIF